ncbi:hypothetical protein EDD11_003047 [Mortierella claussenii]|nr:hypothetical protein EDD11_003047 [Mortierella claussenii]
MNISTALGKSEARFLEHLRYFGISLASISSCVLAHKKRRQKDMREEKADQRRLNRQNRVWENAEAVADKYEYQQMLKAVEAESLKMTAKNTQSSTITKTRAKHSKLDNCSLEEHHAMEEKEKALLKESERLECRVKKLKRQVKDVLRFNQRFAPYGHPSVSSSTHRRATGKRLTEEERRAVLYCFEKCEQECKARIVSTVAPIKRTAHYLGIATETIRDGLEGINSEVGISVLVVTSEVNPDNLKGMNFWGDTHRIPTYETIRKLLHEMGVKYQRVDKAKNYVETLDIKLNRRHYVHNKVDMHTTLPTHLLYTIHYRFGYDVLWLPPYHPDVNPIEEAWRIGKGHVALENDGSQPFDQVKKLLLEGFKKAVWRDLVRRAHKNERKYIRESDMMDKSDRMDEGSELEIDVDEDTEKDEDSEHEDTHDDLGCLIPASPQHPLATFAFNYSR